MKKTFSLQKKSKNRENCVILQRLFCSNMVYDDDFSDNEIQQLVEDFKEMLRTGEKRFFDEEDMEVIIETLLGQIDFHAATDAIEYAITFYKHSLAFRILKVKKLMLELNLEAAGKELEQISNEFPPSPEIYLEKSFYYKLVGKEDLIMPLLKEAYKLDPQDVEVNFMLASEYVKLKKYAKAYNLLFYALENDDIIEEQLFTFSYIFEEMKCYDDAIQFFKQLTNDFPLSKAAWFALALAYSWEKKFNEAIDSYLNVLSLDEKASTAYFNIGNAYYELQDYPKALHYYKETFRVDDQDEHALSGMGDCYYEMHDYNQAIELYHQALLISPNDTEALMGIITVLNETGRTDEAEQFIRKTITLHPQNFELLFSVLPFYPDEERPAKLQELFYQSTYKMEEKEDFFCFFTAYCCDYDDLRAMAIELLEEYLDNEEVTYIIPYLLAALHYKSGNIPTANNYLRTALIINFPDHTKFLSIHPDLGQMPEVQKLITHFYPDNKNQKNKQII